MHDHRLCFARQENPPSDLTSLRPSHDSHFQRAVLDSFFEGLSALFRDIREGMLPKLERSEEDAFNVFYTEVATEVVLTKLAAQEGVPYPAITEEPQSRKMSPQMQQEIIVLSARLARLLNSQLLVSVSSGLGIQGGVMSDLGHFLNSVDAHISAVPEDDVRKTRLTLTRDILENYVVHLSEEFGEIFKEVFELAEAVGLKELVTREAVIYALLKKYPQRERFEASFDILLHMIEYAGRSCSFLEQTLEIEVELGGHQHPDPLKVAAKGIRGVLKLLGVDAEPLLQQPLDNLVATLRPTYLAAIGETIYLQNRATGLARGN
jgi:hypothetical protein